MMRTQLKICGWLQRVFGNVKGRRGGEEWAAVRRSATSSFLFHCRWMSPEPKNACGRFSPVEPALLHGGLCDFEVETWRTNDGRSDNSQTKGETDGELNPKKKVWEQIQLGLHTDAQCVASYKGAAFEAASKGVCEGQTMSNSQIKYSGKARCKSLKPKCYGKPSQRELVVLC